MKLDGIASFVAVAEAGSISEAARMLRLSKSVVSERLAELERSLGATLLHRTTRRMSVTEDGAAFLERARRILREVSEAATDLAERRGALAGPMRLSAPVTFGRLHLGPALYPFLQANPKIEMALDLDDRRVDIASGAYDGVVRHGAIEDNRLMVWRLAQSRRVLVASEAYLAEHGVPKTTAELDEHRGIFYTNRGATDWRFATPDGVEIVRARVGLRVNNGDMIRDAAVAGLGIALLPLFIAGPDLRAGLLRMIDVGVKPAAEFIYLAHPEGRRPSAKLRALAEHLETAFGDPPYWEEGIG
ncbi:MULTISPECIES: LysR family transcriptional regulator [unclassified Rhizobium]|uniref:LysR family transcriptional regulator n=1 Tax=unclassified Rhizobium TaxID=2613769 RepID=UPI0006F73E2B|nr:MULTISPECIES: LysR family transcriptional regulator [unclassified Rhizobium]KQV33582.1 LysR family transcriptional regulator [Rhizobium sp. Root1212]KRD23126.1 LysR family transcriptional regulator [Rhizobium sp. Root268]